MNSILVQCPACKLEKHNVPVLHSEVTCQKSSTRDLGQKDAKKFDMNGIWGQRLQQKSKPVWHSATNNTYCKMYKQGQ